MAITIKRIIWAVWPPAEAKLAEKYLDNQIYEKMPAKLDNIEKEIRSYFEDGKQSTGAEQFARFVYESENKRRETLENKATVLVSAFSLTVSIAVLIPGVFTPQWNIPVPVAAISGFCYLIAIIYFLIAVRFALKARQVEGLAFPSATEFVETAKERNFSLTDNIVRYITYAQYNEPRLQKKSNSLVVAEKMFVRGILFVAIAFGLSGLVKLYQQSFNLQSTNSHLAICQVPNVIGLEGTIAKSLLLPLDEKPVVKLVYSNEILADFVISQEPNAGTLLDPCAANVILTVSARAMPSQPSSEATDTVTSGATATIAATSDEGAP